MKVKRIKHRVIVTPWIVCNKHGHRVLVRAPRTHWFSRNL